MHRGALGSRRRSSRPPDRRIDSAVGWRKGCRSIETRHNKLAVNFMAMLKLTFLRQYLRVLRLSDRT